ncbi:MAG: hypothetical protein J4G13_06040 [Dehalococcoidia bacterium]|nr:hypothetical protein [Dehalococcoidia bacterium]
MTQRIVRLSIVGLAAALMLAAMTGCFFGGEEEPEPTEAPDLAATIAAAVSAAVPTDTPVPPTDTPEPPTPEPTPDLPATLAAMMAASQAAQPQPTDTPTPVPPTNTPVPVPTDTPIPPTQPPPTVSLPVRQTFDGPPCIVAGLVTVGGSIPPAGTPVFAVSQSADGTVVAEDQTDTRGRYQLEIEYSDEVFDIYVRASDSGVDTSACVSKGDREIRNLNVQ